MIASDSIGIDFVPHTYTSTNPTNTFIILLSTFYAVKLSELKISGHSSVVERLVANEKVEGSNPFARSKIMEDLSKKNVLHVMVVFHHLIQVKYTNT